MAGTLATHQINPTAPPDLKPVPSGLRKLPALPMWGAALFAVVVIQIVVTYVLMLPDGAERDSHQDQQDRATTTTNRSLSNFGAPDDNLSEVSLGDFSLSNTKAVRGVIMHVDFRLTALAWSSRASKLESLARLHQERIREAANRIVRSSSLDELNDPSLGALKRQIREEINRLFGKDLLADVVINDFRMLAQ